MDLGKILANVEGKDELVRHIEAEIGKEFVPRSEFNAKNAELKERDKQLGEMNQSLDELTKANATRETELAERDNKIKTYEVASLKARIARESGIPYELADRLSGDDEKSLRTDAETLSQHIKKTTTTTVPLKDTEPTAGNTKEAAYKSLLNGLKGE